MASKNRFSDLLSKARAVPGMIRRAAEYFASQFAPEDRAIFQKSYRKTGRQLENRTTNPVRFIAEADPKNKFNDLRQSIHVGGLYVYKYDPKYKDTLPYWDMFPLLFLIGETADHFIGLNLHYVHPRQRALLMDAIHNTLIRNNIDPKKMDDGDRKDRVTSRARGISYSQLKNASRNALFEPCVKKYLKGHVRTQFVKIPFNEWHEVLFLPLQRFQKKNSLHVWQRSTYRR